MAAGWKDLIIYRVSQTTKHRGRGRHHLYNIIPVKFSKNFENSKFFSFLFAIYMVETCPPASVLGVSSGGSCVGAKLWARNHQINTM